MLHSVGAIFGTKTATFPSLRTSPQNGAKLLPVNTNEFTQNIIDSRNSLLYNAIGLALQELRSHVILIPPTNFGTV